MIAPTARGVEHSAAAALGLKPICLTPLPHLWKIHLINMIRNAAVVLSLAASSALAFSGDTQLSRSASKETLESVGLRAATVQRFTVPSVADQELLLPIELDGVPYALQLKPYDVRGSQATAVVDIEGPFAAHSPTTYRGTVLGMPGSKVAAGILEGGLTGLIMSEGKTWWFQPRDIERVAGFPAEHLVFAESDSLQTGASCALGGRGLQAPTAGKNPPDSMGAAYNSPGAVFREIEVLWEVDHAYINLPMSSGVAKSSPANFTNMVSMRSYEPFQVRLIYTNAIYQNLAQVYVQQVPGGFVNLGETGTGADMMALLAAFGNRWKLNPPDVGQFHLLSGLGTFFSPNVVGYANIGSVCDGSMFYAVSRAVSSNINFNYNVIAHEIGHTLGALHCRGGQSPLCGLMSETIGSATSFDSIGMGQINAYLATVSCDSFQADPGYSSFGAGTEGSNMMTPLLSNSTLPEIGKNFTQQLTGVLPGASIALLLGFTTISTDLTGIGIPGGTAYVPADLLFLGMAPGGTYTKSLPVPNDYTLLGATIYFQAWSSDLAANAAGSTVSNRADATIGGTFDF